MTIDDQLVQSFERVSFLVSTSTPVWDHELRQPPSSGEWLVLIGEALCRARYTLHHAEVRAALRQLLDAYESWEAAQLCTDVHRVARPPPRW